MKLHKSIVTALGSGYAPIAPGTAGSIVGILLLFALNSIMISDGFTTPTIFLIDAVIILFVMFLGVWSIKNVHKIWPHDDQRIVIDEVIGVWIAAFAIPAKWYYYLIALILFRIFDIVKPFGIRKLDALKSNWSVMLDDILAGIYALIMLLFLVYVYPKI
jgi:phosphatidylglycerophosphatase A